MRLIAVVVSGLDAELIADRCWQAGAAGIWQSDDDVWRVGVDSDDVAGFMAAVADLSPVDVTATDALVLAARDVTVADERGDFVLHVPPTVFGDGGHPTSSTSLALLTAIVEPGDTVLDVGCGTGILSVAAARRGATVTAIDIDPDAVDATVANALANGVAVDASLRPLELTQGAFDVVVANITAGSITPLLDDLVRLTRAGGTLIVSGILDHQWEGIAAAIGGRVVEVHHVDGWTSARLEP